MTTDLEFLDNFGFDVELLESAVRFDPIWEVWENFGSFQDIKRSPRVGEHGVFEISDADENHSLSFLLPFDETGALCGPGRIALERREEEIESKELDMAVSRKIWAEIEDDIREALLELEWEAKPDDDGFCLADHRYWMQKYATTTALPTGRA